MTTLKSFRLLALSLTVALAACAKKSDNNTAGSAAPIVASMNQTTAKTEIPAIAAKPATANHAAVTGSAAKPAGALISEVTLNKASILGKSFNYSSSLQFSSVVDGDISTAMMGLSLGEVPAAFNIMQDKLQLLTDGLSVGKAAAK